MWLDFSSWPVACVSNSACCWFGFQWKPSNNVQAAKHCGWQILSSDLPTWSTSLPFFIALFGIMRHLPWHLPFLFCILSLSYFPVFPTLLISTGISYLSFSLIFNFASAACPGLWLGFHSATDETGKFSKTSRCYIQNEFLYVWHNNRFTSIWGISTKCPDAKHPRTLLKFLCSILGVLIAQSKQYLTDNFNV